MAEPAIPSRFDVLEALSRTDGEILLRARDRLLQREVVLRRAAPELVHTWRDREVKDGALRSARAMARVQHPNVVRLLDVLETEEGPLVVLEPVPGESLAARLARDGRLPADEVLRLARDLASALEAVHAQGVVHRGVSATSVTLRPDGSACLGGFVFAKANAALESSVVGSTFVYAGGPADAQGPSALPPHPAPEMVAGGVADARCDLFALGWVLYTALTGAAPYPRDLEVERWPEPADPRKAAPDTTKPLAQVVLRLLKKSPLQRFPSATELRAALEAAAPKADAAATAASKRSRAPLLAGLGVAAGIAIAVPFLVRGGETRGQGEWFEPQRDYPESKGLSETFDRSHALLIGIGKGYAGTGFPDLRNAERDVLAIRDKLEATREWEHWEITTLLGPEATKQRIADELHDLANRTGKDDRVLIYYAGHGAPHQRAENYGYIVPIDGKPAKDDRSHQSWLSFTDSFQLFFESAQAKHVLIAVDCCFGGRVASSRGLAVATTSPPAAKLVSKRAHVVMSSGQKNEEVLDAGSTDHSPFAQAFLDALSSQQPVLTSGMLWGAITGAFTEVRAQTPSIGFPPHTHGGGEFVFFLQPR